LQEQFDDLSVAQDSFVRRGAEEENMAVVREELHRQAGYLRALEAANAKLNAELVGLRERHASVEVLKEEKRGLERRVGMLEELRERVVRLDAEVEAGRREREEWRVTSCLVDPPILILVHLGLPRSPQQLHPRRRPYRLPKASLNFV
jgi:mitotic spindle assembly checkpoint protein MAD1